MAKNRFYPLPDILDYDPDIFHATPKAEQQDKNQERTTDYLRFVTDQFRDENGNVTDQRQTPPLY
jgi:hypothetical protein